MSLNKENKDDIDLKTQPLLEDIIKNSNTNDIDANKSQELNNQNSDLIENIKIADNILNTSIKEINNSKDESKDLDEEEEKDKVENVNDLKTKNKLNLPRKSVKNPFMHKFMNKILSLDENENEKIKK